jgi:hypothetical protein
VDGKSYTQPITVKQDPRVKTPALAMQQVYSLTMAMYFGAVDAQQAAMALGAMRAQATALAAKAQGPAAAALAAFEKKAAALEGQRPAAGGGQRGGGGGGGQRGGGAAPAAPPDTLWAVASLMSGQMNSMQAADVAPTGATLASVTSAQTAAAGVMVRWNALKAVDLPALNAVLKAAGLGPVAYFPTK